MKKSTKTEQNDRVLSRLRPVVAPLTSNNTPAVIHVQRHLRGELLRLEVLHAEDRVARGVLEVLSRHVAELHVIRAGEHGARRPLGQFESVVAQFGGEHGTALHVELRSPVETAADLNARARKGKRFVEGFAWEIYLGIPLVQGFDVHELIFAVRTCLNAILFATDDDFLVIAQIPRTITVGDRCGLVLLVRLDERIRVVELVSLLVLDTCRKTRNDDARVQQTRPDHFQDLLRKVMIDEHRFHTQVLRRIHGAVLWWWLIGSLVDGQHI